MLSWGFPFPVVLGVCACTWSAMAGKLNINPQLSPAGCYSCGKLKLNPNLQMKNTCVTY